MESGKPERKKITSPKGAYLLYFLIENGLSFEVGKRGTNFLEPGEYIYAGNAYGPGGIARRVFRHCNPAKKQHWHIDYLTACILPTQVKTFPGGSECELVEGLCAEGATVPISRFGSSDCYSCPAHLLRVS